MVRNKDHTIFVEKYRPDSMDTFVGNEHLKEKINMYLETNDPPHLLFHGKAGTGKTTLAKIIYNTIECDYLYINASDKGGVDYIRNDIIPFASSVGFSELKLVILDECDFLTINAQASLRNAMETYALNTRFILTCNFPERILDAIQSRCQMFEVYPPSKKEVAIHSSGILVKENIKHTAEDIAMIVNSKYPDIRGTINALQKQSINGQLRLDRRSIVENDYKLKIVDILKNQDKKNAFTNVRQLVANNSIRDFAEVYAMLYSEIDSYAKGHIAQTILILAEGMKYDNMVPDKEINFMAMMIRLLDEIK
jgi:replication factor C small subunit